ncbi:hypothetical protein [Stenotrophomonas maltophilia]|uniref:hypothetical protein n=1 Tax=Stenotrophomonas maltophilia TaxID=40324 RepID=UPI0013DD335B|nr:hypothetical protein [Stenotrophomonas maltophilia]
MSKNDIPSGLDKQGQVILSNRDINLISAISQNRSISAKDSEKYALKFEASEAAKVVLRYLLDPGLVAGNPYDVEAKRIADFFREWSSRGGGSAKKD